MELNEHALFDSSASKADTSLTMEKNEKEVEVPDPQLDKLLQKLSMKQLSGVQRRKIAINAGKERRDPIHYKCKKLTHKTVTLLELVRLLVLLVIC